MSGSSIDVSARYRDLLALPADHRLLQYRGSWVTVGQVRRLAGELDAMLSQAGLGAGARVGLVTRNRPPHVASIVAILSTGRTLVPVTSIQSDGMVAGDLERTKVSALAADEEDWSRAGLAARCGELGALGALVSGSAGEPVRVVDGLTSATAASEADPGLAVLMPTSGTTGPPKRIAYRYEHLNGALERIAKYAPATSRTLANPLRAQRGVTIATLALAHVGGFWAVFQALAEGRPVSLLDRFEPAAWADLVEEHSARTAGLPPTALRMVLDADIPPEKLASLRAVSCGTAPLPPELDDAFTAKYGIPVLTAYGATEFPGGLVGWTLPDYKEFHESKRGAAGRARPGIKIRIVDADTGAELPAGRQGLISVNSPQATTRSENGWVRTNDYARMDEDGFVWILGRADDAINRGGFTIVPQVVEAALQQHPAVAEAAVVGIPDERLGQVPVAAVQLSSPATPEELIAWCRENLARYQVPVQIRVVDDLPRTTSLKVAKDGVRAVFGAAG